MVVANTSHTAQILTCWPHEIHHMLAIHQLPWLALLTHMACTAMLCSICFAAYSLVSPHTPQTQCRRYDDTSEVGSLIVA